VEDESNIIWFLPTVGDPQASIELANPAFDNDLGETGEPQCWDQRGHREHHLFTVSLYGVAKGLSGLIYRQPGTLVRQLAASGGTD
jgi:hypothetical protein